MSSLPLVAFFKEIDKGDGPLVGGKGANLGEMVQAGFPVPPGFAVTVPSYEAFIEKNGLEEKIDQILKPVDVNKGDELDEASKKIQKLIQASFIPDEVATEVTKSYRKLSGLFKNAQVAVRSSATAEDLPNASFAGQQATFLNVKGDANLLLKVRECWASLFTSRAIFYRNQNKIPHNKVKISVIVQKMIQSEVSGVAFTINPVTNEKDRIVIESVWGLGEMIVQGSVVPDKYIVQKETFAILSKEISDQPVQLTKKEGETKETTVPEKIRSTQKISDETIVKIAKIAASLQEHYYFPQDLEWAYENGKIYIVQTRPVTTLHETQSKISESQGVTQALSPVLTGVGASPGIGAGYVKILKSPKEIDKVKKGDVLVTGMTSPDYVPAMKRAAAIVTDQGGLTSHAAIVSRELGIPGVVGTNTATKDLKEGMVVTVDGSKGQIFLGSFVKKQVLKEEKKEKIYSGKTATKVYVNLGEPDLAKKVSELNVDGVGLLRAEFMIAGIGIHPKEAIKRKEQDKFINKLARGMESFCRAFYPRPVVYRATDFKTNEYRSLEGGKFWEPEEPNPLLGFRGAFRYMANPEVFNLELQAIKMVRKKYDNLWLMIPYVRSPEELRKVRRIVAAEELFSKPSFKFWMMVELPVNVILLQDFIDVGIDGVSVGSNDLTMLIEGTDRDNSDVAEAYNDRSPSVLWALKRVIRICLKNNITASICGQAPSEYDDLVQNLVEMGITSVSVNPDSINRVRHVIMEAERELAK